MLKQIVRYLESCLENSFEMARSKYKDEDFSKNGVNRIAKVDGN